MESIFEEEEFARARPTRYVVPLLAPKSTSQGYLVPEPAAERLYYVINDKRKRSRVEALARLYSIRPPNLGDYPGWVQRRARIPFKIYEASLWLAAGLVIVDPLNRLEGVV